VHNPVDALPLLNARSVPDVVIDAIFGTGLSKPVGPELAGVIDWTNRAGSKALVVAVDIPSGLMADSPAIPGPAVKAGLTITFSALKLALVVPPAADLAGRVVVAPIGSPEPLLDDPRYSLFFADEALARRALPPRPRTGHKGTFGHVYIAAGSRGKSGAALMTGIAALRSGAGLVTLWLPESLQREVVGKVPELMCEPLPETNDGTAAAGSADPLLSRLGSCDCLVVGPGLTTHPETQGFVHEIVQRSTVPVVIDADGINAFDTCPELLCNRCDQPIAITPHPGEMARLIGLPIAEIQMNRLETARRWSQRTGCYIVLKGFQTITAAPDGSAYINSTGNPGMATGGTGDILAGIMGRFAAGWKTKGADPGILGGFLAAAVYVHGLAGDLAAEEKGMESLIATDLVPFLPGAFKRISRA
jgi:NAD(P)H-hydrate epimerase